ncbi:MAG: acetylxylan esterase, partial [Candidatus Planktophila sp.]|nr:acetylxylan esterase [Candidatus Planktophila sp.]
MLVGASRQVLETLKVAPNNTADFESFWRSTLADFIDISASPLLVEHPTPMKNVTVKDVTVSGFNGDP